jgi:tetratricopeptide (TPR) repeat protein
LFNDNFLRICAILSARLQAAYASRIVPNLLFALLLPILSAQAAPQTGKSNLAQFKSLSEQAAKASGENRLDEAAGLYAKALAFRPNWIEGWWSLATIEYDRDHYGRAAHDFEKVIALDNKNGTAHAMLDLCQFELHRDDLALKNLLAAENLGVSKDQQLRIVALYHMGVLELRAGKYGAAKETFGQLARDHIRTRELTTGMGLAALLIKFQDAPAEGTPGASVVQGVGQAEILLTANDFDQAKQTYSQLIGDFPDYPNLHFAFGRLLLEIHDTDQAVQQFQLELNRDPRNINSMLEIAVALQLIDPRGGLKYATDAARLSPGMPFAHYILGTLRLASGDAAGAIPEFEIARRRPQRGGRQSPSGVCPAKSPGSETTCRSNHLWRAGEKSR